MCLSDFFILFLLIILILFYFAMRLSRLIVICGQRNRLRRHHRTRNTSILSDQLQTYPSFQNYSSCRPRTKPHGHAVGLRLDHPRAPRPTRAGSKCHLSSGAFLPVVRRRVPRLERYAVCVPWSVTPSCRPALYRHFATM